MPPQRRERGSGDCVLMLKSDFSQMVHNDNA